MISSCLEIITFLLFFPLLLFFLLLLMHSYLSLSFFLQTLLLKGDTAIAANEPPQLLINFFLILRPKVLFLLLKASLVFVFVFVGKMLFCLVVLLLCLPLYLKGHFNYTVEVCFTVCLLLLLCKYTNNFSALFCQ